MASQLWRSARHCSSAHGWEGRDSFMGSLPAPQPTRNSQNESSQSSRSPGADVSILPPGQHSSAYHGPFRSSADFVLLLLTSETKQSLLSYRGL